MLSLEQAQDQILAAIQPLANNEVVPLSDALGRILARRVLSPLDVPPFDNSAMDGYAVRAADVANADSATPISLRVIGRVAAGEAFPGEVSAGTCVRLFTGSPLPRGADAVVMQEDVVGPGSGAATIGVVESLKPWENVRFKAEDVKKGSILVEAGERLTAGRIGLLAATGVVETEVHRRPVVGLIATGNELREAGQPLGPGQIYESNRISLAALAAQAGALPIILPCVEDTLASTTIALERAFAECDVLITSGGVSVGEFDFVKQAFQNTGGELAFWKVAIKPGKPFVFGRRQGKLLFGLPGNPVSAFVTFLVLVRLALLRLQRANEVHLPRHPAVLSEALVNRGDRRHFVRAVVDAAGKVRASGVQASHILASLAHANGLVDVPPQTTLPAGETVTVLRWDW